MWSKNVWTNYGLGALASAIGGGFTPPLFLVIDTSKAVLQGSPSVGANSIQTDIRVDQVGDTQLVMNPGGANQETVTFSSVTGSAPYTYNLSGTLANNHTAGEAVVRLPLAADTLSSVVSEAQYDSVNFPNQRQQVNSGFQSGTGNWTMQFYFTAAQALIKFMTLGLSENGTVGQGNLHDHVVLGYDHSGGGNDVEIDVSLTLTN